MKKLMATALVAVPVVLSNLAFAGSHRSSSSSCDMPSKKAKLSLPELRAKCEELRGSGQVRDFEIHGYCSGSFTKWEEEPGGLTLPNSMKLNAQTAYAKEIDPMHTPGVNLVTEGPQSDAPCSIYSKYVFETGNVVISVQECAEIEKDALLAKCEEALDQEIASANVSEGKKVDTVDTCKMYKK